MDIKSIRASVAVAAPNEIELPFVCVHVYACMCVLLCVCYVSVCMLRVVLNFKGMD